MDIKEAVSRADKIRTYGELLGQEKGGKYNCPFHDDETPSLSVDKATWRWKCFSPSCEGNRGGDVFELYRRLHPMMNTMQALEEFSIAYVPLQKEKQSRPNKSAATGKLLRLTLDGRRALADYRLSLRAQDKAVEFMQERYGITEETVQAAEIGYHNNRIQIPVRNKEDEIVNVRKHRVKGKAGPKTLSIKGHGGTYLYPIHAMKKNRLLLTAGEPDTLLARQLGYNAVTWTGGEGSYNAKLLPEFVGKEVIICYDIDDAGVSGAERFAKVLRSRAAAVSIVDLNAEGMPSNGDLADFVKLFGPDKLEARIREARKIDCSQIPNRPEQNREPKQSPLQSTQEAEQVSVENFGDIVAAKNFGKVIEFTCIIAGTSDSPFFYPKTVRFKCADEPGTNEPKCLVAPIAECIICPLGSDGKYNHDLDEADVLTVIGANRIASRKYLKGKAGSGAKCRSCRMYDPAQKPLDIDSIVPTHVIPDYESSSEDEGYRVYPVYVVGRHAVYANNRYRMTGRVIADPKTAEATVLVTKAEPMSRLSGSYKMDEGMQTKLVKKVAGKSPLEITRERINDIRENVTNIYERDELHFACDLLWHAPLRFKFMGKLNKKISPELLVLGDTRQGKSAVAEEYIEHYGFGRYINCEGATVIGLIGGKDVTGSKGFFVWGALTTSHGGLVVLDEADGLDENALGKLTSVRSRGIAQRTIAGGDRSTKCHVRMLWVSNPRGGKTVSRFSSGCMAVHDLFRSEQDISRLDAAIILKRKNIRPRAPEKVEHFYTREVCQALVQWAWTRMPSDFVFMDGVEQFILDESAKLTDSYGKFALVPQNEMHLKVARLSISLAMLTYSYLPTNPNKVIIVKEHAQLIVDWLDSVYGSSEFGYNTWAAMRSSYEKEETEQFVAPTGFMHFLSTMHENSVKYLLTNATFRTQDFRVISDNPDIVMRKLIIEFGLLRKMKNYYVKVPGADDALREYLDSCNPKAKTQQKKERLF